MKRLRYILLVGLLLWSLCAHARDKWDDVLDRYEQICAQCRQMRDRIAAGEAVPDRSVTALLGELNRLRGELQQASGSMTPAQKARFMAIRDSYAARKQGGGSPEVSPQKAPEKKNEAEKDTPPGQPASAKDKKSSAKSSAGAQANKPRQDQKPGKLDTAVLRPRQPELPAVRMSSEARCELPPADYSIATEPLAIISPESHHINERILRVSVVPYVSYNGIISGGASVAATYRGWGGYISARSNFAGGSHTYECLSTGEIPGGGKFWGNGSSQISEWSVTAGIVKGLSPRLDIYAGAGYGVSALLWQDAASQWALVRDASARGLILDGGAIVHLGNISLLAGLSWLTARPATGPCAPAINLGVGFNIGD